jgi:hypothetical protein
MWPCTGPADYDVRNSSYSRSRVLPPHEVAAYIIQLQSATLKPANPLTLHSRSLRRFSSCCFRLSPRSFIRAQIEALPSLGQPSAGLTIENTQKCAQKQ